MNHYKNLEDKISALKVRISERLLSLCKQFPDAPVKIIIDNNESITIRAKSIDDSKHIDSINTMEQIELIRAIEKYIYEINPVKQMSIWSENDLSSSP